MNKKKSVFKFSANPVAQNKSKFSMFCPPQYSYFFYGLQIWKYSCPCPPQFSFKILLPNHVLYKATLSIIMLTHCNYHLLYPAFCNSWWSASFIVYNYHCLLSISCKLPHQQSSLSRIMKYRIRFSIDLLLEHSSTYLRDLPLWHSNIRNQLQNGFLYHFFFL